LTSSDGQASFTPSNFTFTTSDAGVHAFSSTLKTSGTQSLTATDAGNSLSVTQSGIAVTAATASSLILSGFPTATTAGVTHSFTLTAKDVFGNIATGYTGSVALTSSDAQGVFVPANYTFVAADAGVHSFSATLKTAGTQSISAADAG